MTSLGDTSNRLGGSLTLGVMMDRISEPYQNALVSGLLEGVQAAGANLLCFSGAPIPLDPTANARYRTFELINSRRIDGLVAFVSTLMHDIGKSGAAEYCRRLAPELPFCCIGASLTESPSITTSNHQGISDLIAHLVREHGRQNIAFVRGPLASDEAECRFNAFKQAVAQHGLTFDERLLAVGDFLPDSGREAVRQYSQVRGMLLTDIDAIVASNDSMAVGVLSALEERGISVPSTIAVTGFDDSEEAALVSPALTTIRQPLVKIGRHAARTMLDWILTGTEPEHTEIPTELVVRRSCGCVRDASQPTVSVIPDEKYGFDAVLMMRRQRILEKLVRVSRGELGVAGADWPSKLLNAFRLDFSGERTLALSHFIEEIAAKLVSRGATLRPCHDVIDCLRQELGASLYSDLSRRVHAENVFHATHVALRELEQRGMLRARLQFGRWVRDIGAACNAFSGASSFTELTQSLNTHLPRLGLKEYYIGHYLDGDPEQCVLLAAATHEGQIPVTAEPPFKGRELLPRSLAPQLEGGKAFAVMPLAYRNEILGHALFELEMDRTLAFDEIADAIGTGIRVAGLCECAPRRSVWHEHYEAPTAPGFRARSRAPA